MGCNDIEIRKSEFVAKTQFLSSESLVKNSAILPHIKNGEIRPSYISIFPWGNLILLKDTIKCIFMYIILSTEVSVHINTMMTTFSSGNNNELDFFLLYLI